MEKVFLGNANAKAIQTSNGPWNILEVSFKREDLQSMLNQYTNAKGYCNLKVYARKQATEWSSHTVEVNTWGLDQVQQPTPQSGQQQHAQPQQTGGTSPVVEQAGEEVPF